MAATRSHHAFQEICWPTHDSLQKLASKVSPAVVQIEVAGFGPAIEGDRKDTVLIVHQHGAGAGVIVDPDGYIMPNAHVVEGAQRIRVILSLRPAHVRRCLQFQKYVV